MKQKGVILGIDPGTLVMGFGIISFEKNNLSFVQFNELLLSKYEDPYQKLKLIFERTIELIDTHKPSSVVLEAPFFGKNVQSMLKLGRAQGVAMAASLSKGIEVNEYSPRKVKMAITGNGNASKEQVAAMLQKILNIKTLPKKLDATDGLAVAVCHFFNNNDNNKGKDNKETPSSKKKYKNWSSYVSQNSH